MIRNSDIVIVMIFDFINLAAGVRFEILITRGGRCWAGGPGTGAHGGKRVPRCYKVDAILVPIKKTDPFSAAETTRRIIG
jgi:hypothetical protein